MDMKNKFREICEKNQVPIFLTDWWMDTVSGQNWDVILYEENDTVLAFFVYAYRKKLGHLIIENPPLTPFSGLYFLESFYALNIKDLVGKQNKIIDTILKKLPPYSKLNIRHHPATKNLLPFHWRGISLGLKYTYRINLKDFSNDYKTYSSRKRNKLSIAMRSYSVVENDDIEIFTVMLERFLNRRDMSISFSKDLVKRIITSARSKNKSKIFHALDDEGNIDAILLLLWDDSTAYNLVMSHNPFKNKGALSLLLHSSIIYAKQFATFYDFEGSMVESIERNYREMGGVQTPYFTSNHTKSKLAKFKEIFNTTF